MRLYNLIFFLASCLFFLGPLGCFLVMEPHSPNPYGKFGAIELLGEDNEIAGEAENPIPKGQNRLVVGEKIINPYPLPALTPIYIVKHQDKGPSKKVLAFRAWDFNGDDYFDQVDVLGPDGKVIAELFDLDFDGIVDYQNQK